MSDRFILQAPMARAALLRGVDMMTGLLRPTLGPAARTVAIARIVGSDGPEILDNAATIARRTIQLEYPFEDMGAMIIRQLAWRVFEEAGDGAATAAVICQALIHEAVKYIAAGGNPMILKRGIEQALPVAVAALRRQAQPIDLASEIAGVIDGVVRNPKISEMLGEIMESVGADGAVLVEDAQGTETGYEYIDGIRWNEGYVSHFLLKEGQTDARLINPRIFVTDMFLETAEQLVPVVEACIASGDKTLFVIAPEVRDSALALLIVNRDRGVLDDVMAVKAPSIGQQRSSILDDIAVITGGRCLHMEGQESFAEVINEDLGSARQAWATRFAFGILGGTGSKGAIRQRIQEARAELATIKDDDYTRDKIKERIGKLMGAAAVVRVGAPTRAEQAELKFRIEAAVTAARAALRDGVVPGGGAALVACRSALDELRLTGDEAVGVKILARALSEPMRAIAENAGIDPNPLVHFAAERGDRQTFDVLGRAWVDARQAGIVDPLSVLETALTIGTSAAMMAITIDVLVRHKKPSMATNP